VPYQVFVSYATEDADTASRVCALLEADGLTCWIAPRDVRAGTDYAAAIMDAIRSAQLVVFVFSMHSNTSPYALREIERSVAYGRPVLALRVDRAEPTSSLEYYLHHWIEASQGVQSARSDIITAVRQQLAQASPAAASAGRGAVPVPRPPAPVQPSATKPTAKGRPWYRKTWLVVTGAVLLVAAIGLGLGLGLTRGHATPLAGTTDSRVAWTELRPTGTLPPGRLAPSMAYDQISARLIAFGGMTTSGTSNDTWAYNGAANTWTEVKPPGTLPPARYAATMAYDSVTHRLIMFGGSNDLGVPLNDLWAYDAAANSWTEVKPTGVLPPTRSGHAMVYDPVAHRLITFGGRGAAGVPLNDTWAYDAAANTWTELKPAGTLPPTRSGHAMVYDPVTHRLIIFGGRSDSGAPLDDTWAYDPTAITWTELKPSGTLPAARSWYSMAYDPASGRLIMFGGQDSAGTTLDDSWAYDLSNMWTELEPSGTQPRARAGHVMAADSASGRLVMFGGYSVTPSNLLNDAWTCS
jgi:hypothetical protein